MQTFYNSLKERFIHRMVCHLHDNFFEQIEAQNIMEKDLEPIVRKGVADAENYGMKYEDDLKLYIESIVLLCPNFDKDERFPWAKEILLREDLNGEEKMAEISEYMIFGLEDSK